MIVFITGASSGFGREIAARFVAGGARVIVTGRRTDRLKAVCSELGTDVAFPLSFDVCDRTAVQRCIASLPDDFQRINVLVNNAGLALGASLAHEADLDDWEGMIETNIKGLLNVTHALTPGMVERREGQIINIGSIAAEFAYPGNTVYGATKAFVHHFSLNLRADLHGTGVRVTDVQPGLTAGTEFSNVRFKGDDARASVIYAGAEALRAEDVAETVHWIATRPAHVNINTLQLMPVCQSFGALPVYRQTFPE